MTEETGTKATYYHYKLIKKISIPRQLIWSHITLPVIMLLFLLLAFSWTSVFLFALAFFLTLWVHFVISRSVLYIGGGASFRKRWAFHRKLPWLGYMTDQYIGYSIFRRVHIHTLWIGICLSGVFILWSPPAFTVSLLFWHLWLIAPRLYILSRLTGERKDGMLKFTDEDASYYQQ
ncbi:hypothetical protein GMA19_00015 [Paenibacillus polymyxa E681]|uniref:hypothetical protein n=1 Tax=Paenibacillus polymyxa TaxID=1406 RepID=UPI0005C4A8AC|nr:hypothetical protein [Paenibacillus polymyxa]AJW69082.1 hypothetical protein PPE_04965 [Paenibacillus polymyxa E681]QNV54912.1 hypothetical protein GE561_00015 [Paenibacillus polymyxa E681]QNV59749.1 hypothetical protein GMA19_00015 [Paenibacillus polymyxa E681]